jgi:hypothetical protein
VSDARSKQKSVELPERRVRRLQKARRVRTKEPQGREEPILEPGGRSIAVSGKLSNIREAEEPAN